MGIPPARGRVEYVRRIVMHGTLSAAKHDDLPIRQGGGAYNSSSTIYSGVW